MSTAAWRQLVDQIAAAGQLSDDWRGPFLALSRETFIPDLIWCPDGGGRYVPLSRERDPAAWLDMVYRDDAVITQVDDGTPTGPGLIGRRISSSSSMPSVMAAMLEALAIRDGDRVLEIGTGTGYNAALLASRLGDDSVTSIEVDPTVAGHARVALAAAGCRPHVVVGDGADGYPPDAPYDRVLATAAVRASVPYSWVEQTRPGGVIVIPWGTAYLSSSLLRLTVAEDGTASGHLVDHAAFMTLRAHRVPGEVPGYHRDEFTESDTTLHPYEPMGDDEGGAVAVSMLLPDCDHSTAFEDNNRARYEVLVWDIANTSWATVKVAPDAHSYPVRQHGPRRLWDEVEQAHSWWVAQDRPAYTRFGVSVTPHCQWIWLDHPDNPLPSAEQR